MLKGMKSRKHSGYGDKSNKINKITIIKLNNKVSKIKIELKYKITLTD